MTTLTNERLDDLASGNAYFCVQDDEAAAMAAELKSLRAQLAELGRKKPVAWVSERNLNALKKHQCSAHVKPNNCMVRPIALYDEPVPQAVSQPYTVPDEEIKQALENITHENWRMCEVLRELLKKRPGGVYFTKWEPVIYEALNAPVTDACRAAMLQGEIK